MTRRRRLLRDRLGPQETERGSAAVLVVVMVGVLTALALGGSAIGGLMVGQRRAAAAADLAALAGAAALRPGLGSLPTGSGCDRAARVSAENGARLTGCSIDGREVVVRVAVDVSNPFGGGWAVPGMARAGPAEPSARAGSGP
jgi:secretion/DNA translocation related TadE-like protein